MNVLISIVLCLVFTFLSTLHFYWAFGGHWGSAAVYPTKDDDAEQTMPGVMPTSIVAIGLAAIGIFILNQSELLTFSIPIRLNKFGLWIIAGIFIFRAVGEFNYLGFFKKVKHTKLGINDTRYYSPLCLTIGILTLILKLNN